MEWLKQALNWVKGLFGVTTPQDPEFKPDHSLMLPYTDEAKPLKKMPYAEPFVAHFRKGNKQLHYIATSHEHGVETPTFKTVKQVFETRKPDFVIFEGVSSDYDINSSEFIHYLQKRAATDFPNGEDDYLAYLAHQNGIPGIGGEPNKKQACEELIQKGYTPLDIKANEIVNWIPRWIRWEGIKGDAALDAKIREQQKTTEFNAIFPDEPPLTLESFRQWYDDRDPQHKPLEELTNNDIGPSEAHGATFINRYSAAIIAIRNKNLDKQIAKALNEHDNVLVVYGSGHYLLSRPVYEDMLGKPQYEQLFAPIANNPQNLNAGTEKKQPAGINYRDDWSNQPRNQARPIDAIIKSGMEKPSSGTARPGLR